MKIERTKNTINGFFWGATGKIVNTILPFLLRTVLIYKLGVEYLGLSSLFASILQVLSLSELGFSYACVYAMYKPIAEDDYETVGSILAYLKKIYSMIGTGLIIMGCLFVPFLKQIIHGNVPADVNIYVLYFVYLINSALSYFFFAYKASLLNAMQCNDIISKVALVTNTALRVLQCIVLFTFPNYYAYVILIPLMTLVNNVIKSEIVNKRFGKYTIESEIKENVRQDIKKRIVPLLGVKISTVLLNAADTLVISAYLGLTETALYNNYYFLMTSVQSIIFEVYSSMIGGVGNSLVVDDHNTIVNRFEMLNFINMWLTILCTVCLACLYQPFMRIWAGATNMLPFGMVVLFCVYYYVTAIERIVVVYKDAAGVWKEDMCRCYLGCIMNIGLNLLLVRYIGLYGVIGSSVLVGLFIDPWMGRTVHKKILKSSSKKFYFGLLKSFFVCGFCSFICIMLCRNITENWLGLICRGGICFVVTNLLLLILYHRYSQYQSAKQWIWRVAQNTFSYRRNYNTQE